MRPFESTSRSLNLARAHLYPARRDPERGGDWSQKLVRGSPEASVVISCDHHEQTGVLVTFLATRMEFGRKPPRLDLTGGEG